MNGARDSPKDVFLCHANEDKEEFVRPFAKALRDAGISYWLDEAEITWGASLVKTIGDGLRSSQFIVVFISDVFIGRPWPETELQTALSKQNDSGQTVVLPLLIANSTDVFEKYGWLKDRSFMNWSKGIEALVIELSKLLGHNSEINQLSRAAENVSMLISGSPNLSEENIIPIHIENRDTVLKKKMMAYGGMLQSENSTRSGQLALPIIKNISSILLSHLGFSNLEADPDKAWNNLLSNAIPDSINDITDKIRTFPKILKIANEIQDAFKNSDPLQANGDESLGELFFDFYILCFQIVSKNRGEENNDVFEALTEGEEAKVEFKETFMWDVKQNNLNKELLMVVAKTIVGFLNAKGGHLLIGVDDNGNVVGLERDLKKFKNPSKDGFFRRFANMLETHVDAVSVETHVHARFVEVSGKTIFSVRVSPGAGPSYFISQGNIEYMVRMMASTKSLNAKDAINHYQVWWSKIPRP